MGASNSETTYRIHHWRMQGFGGDLWSLIAPADPEVILWSLIAGEGKLIAIISAFAAECDPAVRKKKHPQVYVYHIFLSKKWKNAPKTLFQHEFVHVGCPPNGKWKFPFKDFFATAKSATRTCKLIGTLGVYVLLVARPTAKGWGYRRHQSEAKEPDQRLKPSRGIFRPIS